MSSENGKAVSKPGVTSWRNINRSDIFTNALNYDTTSVSNSSLDSHLMKNMEWGAVAYLTQSKYGRNGTEITINANSGYYTGGASGANAHTNVLQSTTGNCYGIYDISGGAWEHVAAYLNGTATNHQYGATLVNAANKYKDVYDAGSTTDYGKINGVGAYGEGIYETSSSCYMTSGNDRAGWYSDCSGFVYSSEPFVYRGGHYNDGALAGVFAFAHYTGQPHVNFSWRVVLWG